MAQIQRSPNTAKHLSRNTPNPRINGTLTYTKVGSIVYYDNADIEKLLERNKVNTTPTLFK